VAKSGETQKIAHTVARRSYGKLVALLSSRTRDLAAAEDALSEAFAAALENWPVTDNPDNPEGWLVTAAKRRIIDEQRAEKRQRAASGTIALLAEELAHTETSEIPDCRLAPMFACAPPAQFFLNYLRGFGAFAGRRRDLNAMKDHIPVLEGRTRTAARCFFNGHV